nr:asparagine synthase C-terminal domain-containing protein [Streptomyces roseirectus]
MTALAAKLHDRPVRTYSIGFGAELPGELGHSGLAAAHCRTRHRVLTVSATAVAGDGLGVVLNGEGADPVFGGPKNLPMLVQEMHARDPWSEDRATAYLRSYRKCWTDLPDLLTADTLAALATVPPPQRFVEPHLTGPHRMPHLLNQLLHCNLRTKGAHHILTKVERLTASQGLEGRAPLFDRRVVDHAFTVPPTLKLRGTAEKWVLKEAVRDLLLGREARRRGLWRPDTVRTWLRGDGTLLPRQGGKLWLVLTLELWLRAYDL